MAKLTLTNITNIDTSADDLNANFAAIEAAFENTVSRDGTTPNFLTANLDFNGHAALNEDIPQDDTPRYSDTYVDPRDWDDYDDSGDTDQSVLLNQAHAQAYDDGLLLRVPPTPPLGGLLLGSTVNLQASMWGLGGNGYSSAFARTRFIPSITNGTAAFSGFSKNGLDLRYFTIEPILSGSAIPNPTGTNLPRCIGLQLGRGPCLITDITATNPAVVTTKYIHTLQSGDAITIANVSGMSEINSGTGTVTRLTAYTFSVNINASGYTAYTSGGLVYPTDLGVSTACTRGVIEDVTISGCETNFHLMGWLNRHSGLKSFNARLGLDYGYGNTNYLDYVSENTWQAYQLLGCNDTFISRIEDEGAGTDFLGVPSTIDYSAYVTIGSIAGEGTRTYDNEWLVVGGVSFTNDFRILGGHLQAPATKMPIKFNSVRGFQIPDGMGYNATANTTRAYSTIRLPRADTAAYIADTDRYFVAGQRIEFTDPTAAATGGGLICISAGAGGTATWAALANGASSSATPTIP